MQIKINHDTGFAYSAPPDARVLVLGSMPSIKSLAEQQYYAHPRNTFWPIMGELFGAGPALPYEQRLHTLRESGIALWDVVHQCVRPGSLDINISKAQVNDFNGFFVLHPRVHDIFFNGKTAESLYRKLALPQLNNPWSNKLPLHALPSTSPAHAARSLAEKLAAWQTVRQALETRPL